MFDWQSHRNRKWTRTIAIILTICFVHQDLLWAQGGTPAQASVTPQGTISIPKDVAVTKEVYNAPTRTTQDARRNTIINIQDAHDSFTAQESIVSILDSLVTNYDLKLVAIEGSSGYIDTSVLKTFPDESIRKNTARYFMKKGKMSAGEFFSVTSEKEIVLYGIEEKNLYTENVEQYKKIYDINTSTNKDISNLTLALNNLKDKIYSDDLKSLERNSVLHKDGKLAFSGRWEFINTLATRLGVRYQQYKNLTKFVESLKLEKEIDFHKANKERDSLIDALSKKMARQDLEQLILKSISFKQGKISRAEYYAALQELARKYGVETEPYSTFTKYTEYIKLYESIDLLEIFEEIRKFEYAIKEKLFANGYQRRLSEYSRYVELVKGLYELKLADSDIEELVDKGLSPSAFAKATADRSGTVPNIDAETLTVFIKDASLKYGVTIKSDYDLTNVFENIPTVLSFYKTAEERNAAILANTINKMQKDGQTVAALITGGFHTKGLTDILKQKETSYLVILPKFDPSKGERPYVAILTNRKEPYEELLKSGKYFLALTSHFASEDSFKDRNNVMTFLQEVVMVAMAQAMLAGRDASSLAEGWLNLYDARQKRIASKGAKGLITRDELKKLIDKFNIEVVQDEGQRCAIVSIEGHHLKIIEENGEISTSVAAPGDISTLLDLRGREGIGTEEKVPEVEAVKPRKPSRPGRIGPISKITFLISLALFSLTAATQSLAADIVKKVQKPQPVAAKTIEDIRNVRITPETKPGKSPTREATMRAFDAAEAVINITHASKDAEYKRRVLVITYMIMRCETNLVTRVQGGRGTPADGTPEKSHGPGRGFSQFEPPTAEGLWDKVISDKNKFAELVSEIMNQKWPQVAELAGKEIGDRMSNIKKYKYADALNAAMTAINISTAKGAVPDWHDWRAQRRYYIDKWKPGKPISHTAYKALYNETIKLYGDEIKNRFKETKRTEAKAANKQVSFNSKVPPAPSSPFGDMGTLLTGAAAIIKKKHEDAEDPGEKADREIKKAEENLVRLKKEGATSGQLLKASGRLVELINVEHRRKGVIVEPVNLIEVPSRDAEEKKINLKSVEFVNSITGPVKIVFIMPMYNEEKRLSPKTADNPFGEDALRQKIAQLTALSQANPNFQWKIIAIDDNPKGNSASFVRSHFNHPNIVVDVIPQAEKAGPKGGAVLFGMRKALADTSWVADYIGFTDVDISIDLTQTGSLVEPLYKKEAEVAIGSRWTKGAATNKMTLMGKVSSRLYNWFVRIVLPPLRGIKDTQRGFKLFDRSTLEKILPRATDKTFSFDTELMLLARLEGKRIKEVPVYWFDSAELRSFNTFTQSYRMAMKVLGQRHIYTLARRIKKEGGNITMREGANEELAGKAYFDTESVVLERERFEEYAALFKKAVVSALSTAKTPEERSREREELVTRWVSDYRALYEGFSNEAAKGHGAFNPRKPEEVEGIIRSFALVTKSLPAWAEALISTPGTKTGLIIRNNSAVVQEYGLESEQKEFAGILKESLGLIAGMVPEQGPDINVLIVPKVAQNVEKDAYPKSGRVDLRFDNNFVKQLLAYRARYPKAVARIFAERILHELSHSNSRGTEEEELQEEVDVIFNHDLPFYKLLVADKELKAEVDRFFDETGIAFGGRRYYKLLLARIVNMPPELAYGEVKRYVDIYYRHRAKSFPAGPEQVRTKGLLFRPSRDFIQGKPLDMRLINTSRTAAEAVELLKKAKSSNIELSITGHLRGVDGCGSSLDLPVFQRSLTAIGAKDLEEMPSTPAIASEFAVKIRFEPADDPDAIEYIAPDYGINEDNPYRIKGKISLTPEGRTPNGQKDGPAFIFANIFGLKGVKIICEKISPMALAGGMESSNVFNVALISAASMLSGAGLSQADVFNLAVKLENDEFGGYTGGQGHLCSMTGGAYRHVWLSGVKDKKGRYTNPYSAFSIPLLSGEELSKIEEHMMLVQAGKEYENGKAKVGRTAALINFMWIDFLRDHDEIGFALHSEKLGLTDIYTRAIKNGDFVTAVKAVNRYVDIRDSICKRWISLVLDCKGGKSVPDYAKKYARKVFDKSHPEYGDYRVVRQMYEKYKDGLRDISFYTLDPIDGLVKAARRNGIAIMPLGAGGPGANLIAISSKGMKHLRRFLISRGLDELTEEGARSVVKGTGTLKGYMPFRVGREPISFVGFDRLDIKEPAGPVAAIYDSSTGRIEVKSDAGNKNVLRIVKAIYDKNDVHKYVTAKGRLAGKPRALISYGSLEGVLPKIIMAARATRRNMTEPISPDDVINYINGISSWDGSFSVVEDISDYWQAYDLIEEISQKGVNVREARKIVAEKITYHGDTYEILDETLGKFKDDTPMALVASMARSMREASGSALGVTVGVSVGGTKVGAAAVTTTGEVIAQTKEIKTPKESAEALFNAIIAQVELVAGKVGRDKVVKVGVATPGPVDPETGVVLSPENIPFKNFPLKERIEKYFLEKYSMHIEAEVYHDGAAAVLGEASIRGTAPGAKDLLYIIWGTGIGNGVIKDGRILWNDAVMGGVIGEMGHLLIRSKDGKYRYEVTNQIPRNLGEGDEYFERRMAGPYLIKRFREMIKADSRGSGITKHANKTIEELEPRDIENAAKAGNEFAVELIESAGREFGQALAAFIKYWSRERGEKFQNNIVIGSGVSKLGRGVFRQSDPEKKEVVIEAMKKSLREELTAEEATKINIALSKIDYEREMLAFMPQGDDMLGRLLSGKYDAQYDKFLRNYDKGKVADSKRDAIDGAVDLISKALAKKDGAGLLVAIDGNSGALKTDTAHRLAAAVRRRTGRKAVVISRDWFIDSRNTRYGRQDEELSRRLVSLNDNKISLRRKLFERSVLRRIRRFNKKGGESPELGWKDLYNFRTGELTLKKNIKIERGTIVIVEGNYLLHKRWRDYFDVGVLMLAKPSVGIDRRIPRDTHQDKARIKKVFWRINTPSFMNYLARDMKRPDLLVTTDTWLKPRFIVGIPSNSYRSRVANAISGNALLKGVARIVIFKDGAKGFNGFISSAGANGVYLDSSILDETAAEAERLSDILSNISIDASRIVLSDRSRGELESILVELGKTLAELKAVDIDADILSTLGAARGEQKKRAKEMLDRRMKEIASVYNGMQITKGSRPAARQISIATSEEVASSNIFFAENIRKAITKNIRPALIYGTVLKTENDARGYLANIGLSAEEIGKVALVNKLNCENNPKKYESILREIKAATGSAAEDYSDIGICAARGEISGALAAMAGKEKFLEVQEVVFSNGRKALAAINSFQALVRVVLAGEGELLPPGVTQDERVKGLFRYLPPVLPIDYADEIETYRNAVALIASAA